MSIESDIEKNRLQMKVISRNLSQLSEEDQRKLVEGLKNVPQRQILEQAQYLENVLLPKIKQNRGEDHADYKYYRSVCDSLMWCIFIIDRYEFLEWELNKQKIQNEFLQEQLLITRRELGKYHAAEDLIMSSSLNDYARTIGKKIDEKLNRK